eukprot:g6218.t1
MLNFLSSIGEILAPIPNSQVDLENASFEGDASRVISALTAGADPSKNSSSAANLPLHVASYHGHLEVVKALLGVFIKEGVPRYKIALVDARGRAGNTALHYASRNGHVSVTKVLIANGADVALANLEGYCPLHVATFCNRSEVLKELIAAGAFLNARVGKSGDTALHYACLHGSKDIVKLLLENNADHLILNNEGKSPYDIASLSNKSGSHEIKKLFSQLTAEKCDWLSSNHDDLNSKDSSGERKEVKTPLKEEILEKEKEVVVLPPPPLSFRNFGIKEEKKSNTKFNIKETENRIGETDMAVPGAERLASQLSAGLAYPSRREAASVLAAVTTTTVSALSSNSNNLENEKENEIADETEEEEMYDDLWLAAASKSATQSTTEPTDYCSMLLEDENNYAIQRINSKIDELSSEFQDENKGDLFPTSKSKEKIEKITTKLKALQVAGDTFADLLLSELENSKQEEEKGKRKKEESSKKDKIKVGDRVVVSDNVALLSTACEQVSSFSLDVEMPWSGTSQGVSFTFLV